MNRAHWQAVSIHRTHILAPKLESTAPGTTRAYEALTAVQTETYRRHLSWIKAGTGGNASEAEAVRFAMLAVRHRSEPATIADFESELEAARRRLLPSKHQGSS